MSQDNNDAPNPECVSNDAEEETKLDLAMNDWKGRQEIYDAMMNPVKEDEEKSMADPSTKQKLEEEKKDADGISQNITVQTAPLEENKQSYSPDKGWLFRAGLYDASGMDADLEKSMASPSFNQTTEEEKKDIADKIETIIVQTVCDPSEEEAGHVDKKSKLSEDDFLDEFKMLMDFIESGQHGLDSITADDIEDSKKKIMENLFRYVESEEISSNNKWCYCSNLEKAELQTHAAALGGKMVQCDEWNWANLDVLRFSVESASNYIEILVDMKKDKEEDKEKE